MTLKKSIRLAAILLPAVLIIALNVCSASANQSVQLKGAVNECLAVDFSGDGRIYQAVVTGDMMAGYSLQVFREDEDRTVFHIPPGVGELKIITARNDAKQDIAYVVNDGSGYYVQALKIIGYDGKAIVSLADLTAVKVDGLKQGSLEQQGNKLCFFFSVAEPGYSGPSSQQPVRRYGVTFVWESEANRYEAGAIAGQ